MKDLTVHENGDLRPSGLFLSIGRTIPIERYSAREARWNGHTWIAPGEYWLAPNALIAQRWTDEMNGRGGHAEIDEILFNGCILYSVYVTHSS